MAREKGEIGISGAFEPQSAKPLDCRMIVPTYAELILAATWTANDGSIYAYKGMLVNVHSDSTPALNGLYKLNSLPYSTAANWEKVGAVDLTNYVKRTNETLPLYVPSTTTPLYNWYVTQGAIAPSGWRVPSDSDMTTLLTFLGGDSVAGGKLKEVGTTHWLSPNTGATDEYGYTALPSGYRNVSFFDIGYGSWWTATEQNATNSYNYIMYSISASLGTIPSDKAVGYSLRLMTDVDPNTATVTDYDGNIYDVIQIGVQWWLKQDWKCTHYTNGTVIPNVTDNTAWGALTTGALCYYNNAFNTVEIVGLTSDGDIVKLTNQQLASLIPSSVWGTIIGTLSNQIDLKNRLDDIETLAYAGL